MTRTLPIPWHHKHTFKRQSLAKSQRLSQVLYAVHVFFCPREPLLICIQQSSRGPSPNRGASVNDIEAIGDDRESIADWRRKNDIDPTKQVRLVRLVHMRYQHPDLGQITTFLRDFGMHVAKRTEDKIWYRGYGSDQYVYYAQKGDKRFLGGTYEVESYNDLEKAAKLEGAGKIETLHDAPGGGYLLTLTDQDRFPVNLIFGQKPAETGKLPEKLILNYEEDKQRIRQFQRFQQGPAAVHKVCLQPVSSSRDYLDTC